MTDAAVDARRVQQRILLLAATAQVMAAAFLIPEVHRSMAFAALIVFPGYWWVAGRLRRPADGYEVAAVGFVASFLLLIIVAKDVPGSRWPSFATGTLGALTAIGIWVVQRFDVEPHGEEPFLRRLFMAIAAGIAGALLLSIVASIPIGLALVFLGPQRGDVLAFAARVYGGYFAAGVAIGFFVGLVLPIALWPLGKLILGFLGGVGFYAAVAPAVNLLARLEGQDPMSTSLALGIALLLGTLVGPAVAFSFPDAKPVRPAT